MRAGIVFGDPNDQPGYDEADHAADKQGRAGIRLPRHGAEADQKMRYQRYAAEREHAGDDEALIERPHDRLARAELDKERSDDGRDDADAADGERIRHHLEE